MFAQTLVHQYPSLPIIMLTARTEEADVVVGLHAGDLRVDLGGRRVSVEGREVQLRAKEFDLLARLAREPGRVVPRHQLIGDVWGDPWMRSTKTLNVSIAGLRRALGEQPGSPSRITAVRGVGYRLDPS